MAMYFKCDCCGSHTPVDQWGAESEACVSNDGSPPNGFRTIYTVIEEHDGQGGTVTITSELAHSCAECNANMSMQEHIEAEFLGRKRAMGQK